jgi:glutamate-ammonia-ligase adenylyltransferase
MPGGLIDLEFIAQTATLLGELEGEGRTTSTAETLARLAPGFCAAQARAELVDAYRLFMGLTQVSRLCLTGDIDRGDMPPGLADLLLRNTDLPDLVVLEAHVAETAKRVRSVFDAVVCGK